MVVSMFLLLALCLLLDSTASQRVEIQAGGASFPWDAYRLVFRNYVILSGVNADYAVASSSVGKAAMVDGLYDFAGSDSPISADDYIRNANLQMMPSIVGAIAVVVNIPAFRDLNTNILLDADLISKIFRGEISDWGDAAIAKYNYGMCQYLDGDIEVVYRASKSGTNTNLNYYLQSADANWQNLIDELDEASTDGFSIDYFPVDPNMDQTRFTAYTSTSKMIDYIMDTPYVFGYAPFSSFFGLSRGYVASVQNDAGEMIYPTYESVLLASERADFDSRYNAIISDSPAEGAYPISTFSYWIISRESCYHKSEALGMLNWYFASHEAANILKLTGFSPVGADVISTNLDMIRNLECNGDPILKKEINLERPQALVIIVALLYVVVALLTLVGFGQFVLSWLYSDHIRTSEEAWEILYGLITVSALNTGVIAWFLTPSTDVCRARWLVFLAWTVIIGFFTTRTNTLISAVELQSGKDLNLDEETASRFTVAAITFEALWVMIWVFGFNTRYAEEIVDPVEYSGEAFCTCDSFEATLIFQGALIGILILKLLSTIWVVLRTSAVSRTLSRRLLMATVNLIGTFGVSLAYGWGLDVIADVDWFLMILLINTIGFGPLFASMIKFDASTIASLKNSRNSRNRSRN
jgi:ABC-type phosphate transport system substrate-binding protein